MNRSLLWALYAVCIASIIISIGYFGFSVVVTASGAYNITSNALGGISLVYILVFGLFEFIGLTAKFYRSAVVKKLGKNSH